MCKKMFLFLILLSIVGPSIALATEPNLVAWWTFDDEPNSRGKVDTVGVKESIGGYNGVVYGDPNSVVGYHGRALQFMSAENTAGTRIDDYVDMSATLGNCLKNLGDFTLATWINFHANVINNWQRISDFGNDTTVYAFWSPSGGTSGTSPLRFAMTINSNGAESQLNSPSRMPSGWHYITVTSQKHAGDANNTMRMYIDAALVNTNNNGRLQFKDLLPAPLTQCYFGKSMWADDYLDADLDDYMIFSYALDVNQIEAVSDHLEAWLRSPPDLRVDANLSQTLKWFPGAYISSTNGHKVYVSTSWDDVNALAPAALVATTTNAEYVFTGLPDKTYYWRIVEVNGATEWKNNTIWRFTLDAPTTGPQPADGQGGVSVWLQQLSWTPFPATGTTGQKICTAKNFADVNNGVGIQDIGPKVNTWSLSAIPGLLPFNYYEDFYWRIDTVFNGNTYRGPVWKFTTAFPINFCDDFSKSFDYWRSYGKTTGTIWDGVVGNTGALSVMSTDTNVGNLHVEWSGRWSGQTGQGILIYKEVDGPYLATVQVKNQRGMHVFPHENFLGLRVGLMARLPDTSWGRYGNESDATGEDWVTAFFYPTYGVGNSMENQGWYFRTTGDAGGSNSNASRRYRTTIEMNRMFTGWPDNPADGIPGRSNRSGTWVQLDYKGHGNGLTDDGKAGRFYGRYSSDGWTWYAIQNFGDGGYAGGGTIVNHDPLIGTYSSKQYFTGRSVEYPINRYGDMNGYVHQVGIAFSSDTNPAWADVDNFCLGRNLMAKATAPYPASGASLDIMRAVETQWNAGDLQNEQDYFFSDVNSKVVQNATATRVGGVPVPPYRGNTTDGIIVGVGVPNAYGFYPRYSYSLANETLQLGKTYYWRVDEVNTVTSTTWKGDVWSFSILSYAVVDNFDSYTATGDIAQSGLRRVWIDGRVGVGAQDWTYPNPPNPQGSSGSYAQVNTDVCDDGTWKGNPSTSGARSLKLYYDNDGAIDWLVSLYNQSSYWTYTAPKYSEVSAAIDDAARLEDATRMLYPDDQTSLGIKRDWTLYKILKISYYGDWTSTKGSTSDKLYVGLSDGTSRKAVIYCPDTDAVMHQGWHTWYLLIADFKTANPSLDMTDLARIYLGVGNPSSPVTGGRGAIFVDDIQLLTAAQCAPLNPSAPEYTGVANDWNADCITNTGDLRQLMAMWLRSTDKPVAGPNAPIIKLDATNPAIVQTAGKVSTWPNQGSKGGNFIDACSTRTGYRPVLMASIEGKQAVYFDGNDGMVWDSNTPPEMVGAKPWTVVATLWRSGDVADSYDTEVFVWGSRTVPNGFVNPIPADGINYSQGSLCYNTNGWGAFGGWGGGDRGLTAGNGGGSGIMPPSHEWHTLAITYEGGMGQFYAISDGKVYNATPFTGHAMHIMTDKYGNGLRTMLGSAYSERAEAARYVTPLTGQAFTGAVAKLEVYDYFMTPAKINELFMGNVPIQVDLSQDADKIIDFKDIAVFANSWMTTSLLGG